MMSVPDLNVVLDILADGLNTPLIQDATDYIQGDRF